MILDQLKHLRAHLLQNWNYAHEWIHRSHASNGAPCLIFVLNSPNGDFSELNRAMDCNDATIYFSPFNVLYLQGKEGLLREFDRAIARLEEHQEVESGRPEPLPELITA